MSNSGAQAYKFYEEVAKKKELWFAENSKGVALEFDIREREVSFPLWSSDSRIIRLKKLNSKLLYDFNPRKISWESFKEVLVPMLTAKQRVVGVNLSGKTISGFDMSVESVVRQVESHF
jgi:hypothetical protein